MGSVFTDSPAEGNLVTMQRYTGEERSFCVREYYRNNNSGTIVRRNFRQHFGLHDLQQCPSLVLIRQWVRKFEETGSTLNKRVPGRRRSARSAENIERVRVSVRQQPMLSSRKRAAALNVSRSSVLRMLNKDLHLNPFKIQLVQELKPTDPADRLFFANEIMDRFPEADNILFSDEAHFHLNGHVNKQNCRYWSRENPKQKHQRPLHSPKVTVWAAMSASGIIGPFFFEDDRGHAVTVNSQRYVEMIQTFFTPALQEFDGYNQDTWFQQDGATCHTSNLSLPVVQALFPEKLISRREDIQWPPRSPDLTPCDFFLWGYLKSQVYRNSPATLDALKNNIRREIEAITEDTCRRVMVNFRGRLQECQERNGAHLDNVIFKT